MGKKLGIISFPRNHFVITKYVISLERNDFEGTKYENMSFRGNEITLIFSTDVPLGDIRNPAFIKSEYRS